MRKKADGEGVETRGLSCHLGHPNGPRRESHAMVEEQMRECHAGFPPTDGPIAARKFTGRGGCRKLKSVKFIRFIYIGK